MHLVVNRIQPGRFAVNTKSGEVLLESKSRRATFSDDPASYPWKTA